MKMKKDMKIKGILIATALLLVMAFTGSASAADNVTNIMDTGDANIVVANETYTAYNFTFNASSWNNTANLTWFNITNWNESSKGWSDGNNASFNDIVNITLWNATSNKYIGHNDTVSGFNISVDLGNYTVSAGSTANITVNITLNDVGLINGTQIAFNATLQYFNTTDPSVKYTEWANDTAAETIDVSPANPDVSGADNTTFNVVPLGEEFTTHNINVSDNTTSANDTLVSFFNVTGFNGTIQPDDIVNVSIYNSTDLIGYDDSSANISAGWVNISAESAPYMIDNILRIENGSSDTYYLSVTLADANIVDGATISPNVTVGAYDEKIGKLSRQYANDTIAEIISAYSSISITGLEVVEESVNLSEQITIKATAHNSGIDVGSDTKYISIYGPVSDFVGISFNNVQPGETVTKSVTYTPPDAGDYRVIKSTYMDTFTVKSPASIEVVNFTVPNKVNVNESFDINATVTNSRGVSGSKVVSFYAKGSLVHQETVEVAGGATKYVTYTHTFEEPGDYNVTVENLANQTVTVAEKEVPTVSTVTVMPSTKSLMVDDFCQFNANATWTNGTTMDVTGAANWSVDNTTVGTVSDGNFTADANGTTYVNATYEGVSGSATVTVTTAPTIESVSVIPDTKFLTVGDSHEFTANATWTNGTTMDVTDMATWNVSNDTVGSVDAGNFTAAAAGNTTVTATYEGVSGSADVTVEPVGVVTVENVTVIPSSLTLQTPASYTFKANATWTNGTTMDVTQAATWSLSNGSLSATIANGEFVQIMEVPGTTYVNATYEGVTGSALLNLTTEAVGPEVNATDPNGDGLYEDVSNDESFNFGDVVSLFNNFESSQFKEDKQYFDFNNDGSLNFGDVVELFNRL